MHVGACGSMWWRSSVCSSYFSVVIAFSPFCSYRLFVCFAFFNLSHVCKCWPRIYFYTHIFIKRITCEDIYRSWCCHVRESNFFLVLNGTTDTWTDSVGHLQSVLQLRIYESVKVDKLVCGAHVKTPTHVLCIPSHYTALECSRTPFKWNDIFVHGKRFSKIFSALRTTFQTTCNSNIETTPYLN